MHLYNSRFSLSILGYGMSYRYFDEMAQTYCSSQLQASAFVFAIRRDCGGIAPPCNDICKDAKDDMLNAIGQQRKEYVYRTKVNECNIT